MNEEVGEGSDAWEASQAILKAINVGSLLQVTATKPAEPPLSQPPIPDNAVPDPQGQQLTERLRVTRQMILV